MVYSYQGKRHNDKVVVAENQNKKNLGGEPEILLRINGILEAGPRERADAAFLLVFALEDGGDVGFMVEHGLLPDGCVNERFCLFFATTV